MIFDVNAILVYGLLVAFSGLVVVLIDLISKMVAEKHLVSIIKQNLHDRERLSRLHHHLSYDEKAVQQATDILMSYFKRIDVYECDHLKEGLLQSSRHGRASYVHKLVSMIEKE